MSFMDQLNEWVKRYFWWLLAGALFLALLLRFINLGAARLSDLEAGQALQALSIVNGQETVVGGAPGYVSLTSLVFFLFGGSDFFARFWPAVFGTVLVLLPGLFRKNLDDPTAVILAFLIALEPGLVILSRTADGTIMTIFSLFAAAGFFINRKLIPAGVFAGIALVSSQNFWPLAFVLFFACFLTYIAGRQNSEVENKLVVDEKPNWWQLGISALITVLLVSSQFFLYPAGISGIGSSLIAFLDTWHQTGGLPLGTFLMMQLVTQFPAIIFGVWGLIAGLREKKPLFRFLGLWWITGLILWAANPSLGVLHISMINLPIFVLSAIQIVRLIENIIIRSRIVAVAESVVTVSLILFSSINFLNLISLTVADPVMERNRIIGTFLPIVLWIVFSMLLAWGWDVISTKGGMWISFAIMFTALLIGSGWKAAGLGSRPENELLSGVEFISGKSELMQTISDLSRWNTGQANHMDIKIAGLEKPSLVWVLRDFNKLTVDSTFPVHSDSSIILSSPDSIVQSLTSYRGSMLIWSLAPDFSQFLWQDWFKWFFIRTVPEQKGNILLWVRNDLFKDASSQIQTP